jgi:formylglycine-generating enzyme required for sulfatase activity
MSRIFLSHSSKDTFEAIAVRDWLATEGWNDVFLDLDPNRGIVAGERWERALHQAAMRCEAVIFLISENWLASRWCLNEYWLARKLNKKLFASLVDASKSLKDLPPELTGTWQVVDLAGGQDAIIMRVAPSGSYEEKHVALSKHGLRSLKRGLEKAGLAPEFFAWPPHADPHRSPYRGFKPLEDVDAGIFFGRDAAIVEAIDRLRGLTAASPPRLLVLLGASGAGKSSFLRAGLLPRLARDDSHFAPLPVMRPERSVLFGENGLLQALASVLVNKTRAELRAAIQAGATRIRPLLAELADASRQASATEKSRGSPAIVMAIDQAEELFRADGSVESSSLLELIRDLTTEDDPAVIVIFAIRSDSYDSLEHAKALEGLPQATLPLLPMPRAAYKDVIEGPARRFQEAGGKLDIEPRLTHRLLEDIEKGAGRDALPLLAFALEQLFLEYGAGGALRLDDYETFGGLRGAINAAVERVFVRADADARIPRERSAREMLLRRGLIPWLAGMDPETRSPRRNIALKEDIPAEAATLVELLVDERLLATDATKSKNALTGEDVWTTTIEPAHEALLRQWGLLQGWLEEDLGLLVTLEAIKRAARDWDANARSEAWLAHQGQRLAATHPLDARPDIKARLTTTDRNYLAACFQSEARRKRSKRRTAGLIAANVVAVTTLTGYLYGGRTLKEHFFRISYMQVQPLTSSEEGELRPGDSFSECSPGCPRMIVIPPGEFQMGSDKGASEAERPVRNVRIGSPLAIGKFDVTFAEWEACVKAGACPVVSDGKMGRDMRPVVNVGLEDIAAYLGWLARTTGKRYRLPSEAEWEYAARAGASTRYFWGDDIGTGNALCRQCGSESDPKGTLPVDTFRANQFGLHDMAGNVWQWVEDPWHPNYAGAPTDGSVWTQGADPSHHVVRGGAWDDPPESARSAYRGILSDTNRGHDVGFRVVRDIAATGTLGSKDNAASDPLQGHH